MITNGGNPDGLFRAAIMQSGGPLPTGDIIHAQPYYDAIVAQTGCASSADTLACLRTVSYVDFKAAVDAVPNILSYKVGLPPNSAQLAFSGLIYYSRALRLRGHLEQTAFSSQMRPSSWYSRARWPMFLTSSVSLGWKLEIMSDTVHRQLR
jgi:hypothetical protein